MLRIRGRALVLCSFLAMPVISQLAGAQTGTPASKFDRAVQQTQKNLDDARASQRKIDQLDDEASSLLQRYRTALLETQRARQYSQQIEALASTQAEQQKALERQLSSIEGTERDLLPLMLKMVATLDQFIARDLPFLKQERQQRVANLKGLMIDPTVGLGEKYRRVLEAYQIEDEYGRGLGVERSEMNGKTFDLVRVGRTTLYALALDGGSAQQWDIKTRRWQSLPPRYLGDLKQAVKIARGSTAADLLLLPVPTTGRKP